MAATITTQPTDSTATVGSTHTFSVVATGVGNLSYQWIVEGEAVVGATSDTFTTLTAELDNSYSRVTVQVVDDDDNAGVVSEVAFAISQTAAATLTRHSLVWNYDDNNFVWRDPAVEIDNNGTYKLYDVTYTTYGFQPGYQERWIDYQDGNINASSWADAKAGQPNAKSWADTSSRGVSKQIMQISNGNLYFAEQVLNRQDSLKRYYVTRTQIDMDDLVSEWTTNRIKQIKQFTFHMQSDQRFIDAGRDNNIDFYVGWANNLMEDPNWKAKVVVDLEDRANGGDYKIDYRSSGRYLSYSFDFTSSTQLALTGGDIDANVVAGR